MEHVRHRLKNMSRQQSNFIGMCAAAFLVSISLIPAAVRTEMWSDQTLRTLLICVAVGSVIPEFIPAMIASFVIWHIHEFMHASREDPSSGLWVVSVPGNYPAQ